MWTRLDDPAARVFFCVSEGFMVLLHGFVKKSRKTPTGDLARTRRRRRELENA